MATLFVLLLVAIALVAVVGVMYVVLNEKIDHEAHQHYVRTPWVNEKPKETANEAPATIQEAVETVGAADDEQTENA